MIRSLIAIGALPLLALGACSQVEFPASDQVGDASAVKLPAAEQYLFPPMNISTPVGWEKGQKPTAPDGFTVTRFGDDMAQPRNVLPLPNGDVLVAEAGGPGTEPVLRPKDLIYGIVKGKAHSSKKPGMDVVLLRDANGDGVAEQRTVLAKNLNSPFGLAYGGGKLYVADTDAVLTWDFTPGQTALAGPPTKLTDLPGPPYDHHWTKSIVLSPDGSTLYAGTGSNSNIVERGMEAEQNRALIWEVNLPSGAKRPYATGLRNPNGLTFNPTSGQLWAVVNERDELGNNLVPDYMTSVREGAFYGWPYSYYGQHVDPRVRPQRPDLVAKAVVPDYSLSSHVAPLGMAFGPAGLPGGYAGGAFVGEHGSWDRKIFNGYRVSFVPFAEGRPAGKARDFVTGFITPDGKTHGRPVGVAFGPDNALYVADDVGNIVWRIAPNAPTGGGRQSAASHAVEKRAG
ncbi:sorbosone dehydrogenase family protein [Erythrobacter sp. 3-20A1M]|uniref:PQQ-dependent sugar dehydrogenase n=1 Tax=Erythrobacter sp. 3-20A1M TaxID=2653850 RepID=UPI001BFC0999|nr:sorbosone dehydrogenase family protein [Erythrobacter sp. 3-20A1M]QWC56041.1 sorbosone dehydrogenase family protein [Erythrobacter sp. 3-20A1M]